MFIALAAAAMLRPLSPAPTRRLSGPRPSAFGGRQGPGEPVRREAYLAKSSEPASLPVASMSNETQDVPLVRLDRLPGATNNVGFTAPDTR